MTINKTLKKVIAILMLIALFFSNLSSVFATDINSAYLENHGDCGRHLQYWKDDINDWSYVITTLVYYNHNGSLYPAYCLNRDKHGVGEEGNYTVNISKVLDDERVWRTILAGYPYKTPSQMGVATVEDAFVATKQAVYCIIYGFDVESRYNGADDRGEAIKNAMINMVNEGRYGSRHRVDAQVTFNKIGAFQLDSNRDYYSQEYSVTSAVDMSNYTITDALGFPAGTLITDMNNNQTNTFNAGSHFKVLVPVSALENEITGTLVGSARCKTYPIFYGETPNSAWQDYAVTFDPYSTNGGRTDFRAKVVGTAEITKVEYGNTDNKLSGAKYQIFKDVNNNQKIDTEDVLVTETGATDENGTLEVQLGIGNYVAKESVAPTGYNLSKNVYPFSFTPYDLNASFTDQDIIIKGGINVTKTDREDDTKRLEGAKYDIYKDLNNNEKLDENEPLVASSGATDENGIVAVENLTYGHYIAKESVAPQYYELDKDDIPFFVETEGQIINIIAKDIASKGDIKIIKTSEDNKNISGIQFRIKGTSFLGQEVDEIVTTDENGIATLKDIQIGENFTAEEINVPEGYVKPENKTFNITANEETSLDFYNAIIKGKINITKTSSEYNDLSGFEAGTPLPGTEYTIYDKDMHVLQVVTTDENGTITTDYINYGKVYIKETKAPTYYLIDDAVHEMFIKNNEVVEFFTHTDESVKIKVDVYKQGIKQTTCGQEIRYDFSNIRNNSNVPLDNFYWLDNLPEEVRINSLFTGTYNQNLEYTISYKTNKNNWKDIEAKYSTQTNNYVDFKSIALEEDEFITDYRLNFGTTNPGFSEVEKPFILVTVNQGLNPNTIFTNYTTVGGSYLDKTVTESSKWSTCLYQKALNVKKLPKTGF